VHYARLHVHFQGIFQKDVLLAVSTPVVPVECLLVPSVQVVVWEECIVVVEAVVVGMSGRAGEVET